MESMIMESMESMESMDSGYLGGLDTPNIPPYLPLI